jgi:exosortase/archaeosortase family protein
MCAVTLAPSIAFAGSGGGSGGGGGGGGSSGGGGQTGGPPGMGVDFPPMAFLLGGVMLSMGFQHIREERKDWMKRFAAVESVLLVSGFVLIGAAFVAAAHATHAGYLSLEALTIPAILCVCALLARQYEQYRKPMAGAFVCLSGVVAMALAVYGEALFLILMAPLILAAVASAVGGRPLLHRGAWLWFAAVIPTILLLEMRPALDLMMGQGTAEASVFILSSLGFDVTVVGTTIHGLSIPVRVTTLCAGCHVLAGAFLVSALVASVFLDKNNAKRGQLIIGFVVASLLINVLRVVTLSSLVGVGSAELAIASHDAVGYAFSLGLHALLIFGALKVRSRDPS